MSMNGTIMQYFQNNDIENGSLWKCLKKDSTKLKNLGVTAVWLPPAFKGALGASDDGYTPYDLYDLGEFDQKGSVATKYGTKAEYVSAIKALHTKNINVYADIVLGSRYGADEVEKVDVQEFLAQDSIQMVGSNKTIGGLTKYTFSGRKKKYSDFTWNWSNFSGINWDKDIAISDVTLGNEKACVELEAYDYIINNKINYNNEETFNELVKWCEWYKATANVDGFVQDIASDDQNAYKRMLDAVTGEEKNVYALAKLWHWDVNELMKYVSYADGRINMLDVPLHFNFHNCSKAHGNYDLRTILDGSLVSISPVNAVTFVDNHDSKAGGLFESYVEEWFKPMAYALILLRQEGYPCVSYEDYIGDSDNRLKSMKRELDKLLKIRSNYAYGVQHDYFDDPNCIGFTREGDEEHEDSGLAVVISDGTGGTKHMYIGKKYAGAHFSDVLGNAKYNIKIDDNGYGNFYVNRGAVSVWVRKEKKSR